MEGISAMKNQATQGVSMRRTTMGLMMALVAVAAIMLDPAPGRKRSTSRVLLTQVTDRPSQTPGGAHFTMVSNVMVCSIPMPDLLGNGNTVPQIFVFDTAKRILQAPARLLSADLRRPGAASSEWLAPRLDLRLPYGR